MPWTIASLPPTESDATLSTIDASSPVWTPGRPGPFANCTSLRIDPPAERIHTELTCGSRWPSRSPRNVTRLPERTTGANASGISNRLAPVTASKATTALPRPPARSFAPSDGYSSGLNFRTIVPSASRTTVRLPSPATIAGTAAAALPTPQSAAAARSPETIRRRGTRSRYPVELPATYFTASGLTGDPTAPMNGSGGAVNRKSQPPSARQSAASASSSKISPISRPM